MFKKFEVGEFVWIFSPPSMRDKFGRGWKGPYLIVDKLNDVNYVVQENPTARLITLHVDHLKSYKHETPENWSN